MYLPADMMAREMYRFSSSSRQLNPLPNARSPMISNPSQVHHTLMSFFSLHSLPALGFTRSQNFFTLLMMKGSAELSALAEKQCAMNRLRTACLRLSISVAVLNAPEPASMVLYHSDLRTLVFCEP